MGRFAWRNLLTRPLRTALALIGLSVPILGVIGLFSLSGGLRDLVGNTLSKVKGGETLKRVLLALAKNGFNLKQTAESLHIHTNTLRYRLARSLEVLKIDLDDPEVRFQLQLAVRIIDFSNSKEPGG